jgi:hypothetical protein
LVITQDDAFTHMVFTPQVQQQLAHFLTFGYTAQGGLWVLDMPCFLVRPQMSPTNSVF